jgi:hypothetical protein
MDKDNLKNEQQCAIHDVRHSAFFDEVCERDFNEWNKEMKVIETYPKWEVLANALGIVKRWKSFLHCA